MDTLRVRGHTVAECAVRRQREHDIHDVVGQPPTVEADVVERGVRPDLLWQRHRSAQICRGLRDQACL